MSRPANDLKKVADHKQIAEVANQQANTVKHPEDHDCPITTELMQDPVVASDGFSYERTAIEAWLQRSLRSPKTGKPMTTPMLVPNTTLKIMIQDFQENALKEKKQTEEKNRQFLENEKLKFEATLQKALQDQKVILEQQQQRVLQKALQDQKVALEQQQQRTLQKALQDQKVAFQQQQQRTLQGLVQQQQRALQASDRQHHYDLEKAFAKQQTEPQQRLDDLIHQNTDSKSKMEPYANGHQRPNPLINAYVNHQAAAIAASIISSSLLPAAATTPEDDGGDALDALAKAGAASASFTVDSLDSGDFKKSNPAQGKPKSLDSNDFACTPPFASAKSDSKEVSGYKL